MKLLTYALITLFIAVSVSLIIKNEPGYLLIDIGGLTVETTLTFAIVVLSIVFALLYTAIRFVVSLFNARNSYKRWSKIRTEKRSSQFLTKGLIALAEGKWHDAERIALKNANQDEYALLNYLTAARAAQEQHAYERRDLYLKDAHHNMPTADIAVGLTQAELLLNQNQLEQALATLRHLQQLSPKHTQVLKILAELYIKLNDWEHIVELLPALRKRKIFSTDKLNELELQAYRSLLLALKVDDHKGLKDLWYRIPSHVQEKQEILSLYIEMLIKQKKSDIAEPLIRNALRVYWDETLVRYYGVIDAVDVKSQLEYAESWLKAHENNPIVLLTLGRLALKNGLWGKARSYLEASVGAHGPAQAHYEYAHLLEQLGEHEKALQYYKSGLRNTPECESPVTYTITAQDKEHAAIPSGLKKAATGGF